MKMYKNLFYRSMVAGVSGYEIMLAQVLTQFVVLIGQVATTLIFTLVVFQVPCNGPVVWVIVLALLQGTAGMCFGN
jgi:type IV secretory pathway TrbD component